MIQNWRKLLHGVKYKNICTLGLLYCKNQISMISFILQIKKHIVYIIIRFILPFH